MENPVVELKDIVKIFPGVTALDHMSLRIKPGEIHGLIGENGAGKSTLIKVLTGVHIPEEGEIFIEGTQQKFRTPNDARDLGISCVYQELNIVQELNVVDNLFLGNYQLKGKHVLDKKTMYQKTKEIMTMLEQDIDPNTRCGELGIGQQQMIEIGRAILTDAKVIILDEPTSSLGEKEAENLFQTVRNLKEKGVAFLFVSHKLEELFILCDSVTVMRDSKHIITEDISKITNDELITYMVGRSLNNLFPKIKTSPGEIALSVQHLTRTGEYYDVCFEARRGEILGFSGLVGAGRTELFRGIFGAEEYDSGEIYINGKKCRNKSPEEAISNKVAFLTEDRKNQGLILPFSVAWNLCSVVMERLRKGLILDKKQFADNAKEKISQLNIKVSSPEQLASQLSGGNQQKVVIGKWISADADIYIFDEPTKGIDVGSKIEVYNIMNRLVQENKCVIMISSELPEILGMSDRVIVMRSGRQTGEISRDSDDFNQESIMKAAWGLK